MASGFSDYFENKVLGLLFGGVAYTIPSTYYVGLWTTTLSDSSTGSTSGEPVGGGYARVALTNNSSNFSSVTIGETSNIPLIAFAASTASWGTITNVGLCDAITGGNLLAYSSFVTPISVAQYDTVIFKPGDFDITLN